MNSFFPSLRVILFGALGAFSVIACGEQDFSYSYLMLHPETLQTVYNECIQVSQDDALPCKQILLAQADFTALLNLRQEDPEQFGARILKEQHQAVVLKAKQQMLWERYKTLGRTKPGSLEVTQLRLEAEQAQADYQKSANQVAILLKVIAVTSHV